MRTHEEFCAEITSRKNKIVKKRKERRQVMLACIPFILCIALFAGVGIRDRILYPLTPDVGETEGAGAPETVMETIGQDEQTDRFPTDGVIESIPPIVIPDDGFEEPPEEIPDGFVEETERLPDGVIENLPPVDDLPDGNEWVEEGTAWDPPVDEERETQVEVESEDSSSETESGTTETEFLSAETGMF